MISQAQLKLNLGLGQRSSSKETHLKPEVPGSVGGRMGRRRSRSPSIASRAHASGSRTRSPTPIGAAARSASPSAAAAGAPPHPSVGESFADAVHDLVDEVHFVTSRRGRAIGWFPHTIYPLTHNLSPDDTSSEAEGRRGAAPHALSLSSEGQLEAPITQPLAWGPGHEARIHEEHLSRVQDHLPESAITLSLTEAVAPAAPAAG